MMLNEKSGVLVALGVAAAIGAVLVLHKKAATITAAAQPQAAPQTLDAGLSPTEAHAVNTALSVETNPSNLHAFAATMTPDFPIAASMLTQRAFALTGK